MHNRHPHASPGEEDDGGIYDDDNNDKPTSLYTRGFKVPETIKSIYSSFVTAMVMLSLRYYNSYEPMTRLINVISWLGLIQMSTASMWNASLDVYVLDWLSRQWTHRVHTKSNAEAALVEMETVEELEPLAAAPTVEEEEECGA
ncbi:unnamed protein product [Aphanomyces euteiches]